MNNHQIRFGVIGMGAIGPSHIFAINQTAGAELSAICDVQPEKACQIARDNGVPFFSSIEEMLQADIVDAVTICTPSGLHLEPCLQAIEAGKHVLVEKPLEITVDRIDRIIKAAKKHEIKLGCVFQSRFKPIVQELKRLLDKGMLGEIYSASAYTKRYRTQEYYNSGNWRGTWKIDGGGCLMNQGIHLIDLFTWFLGNVEEVIAIIENRGRKVEVETLALSLVKFTNGVKGIIEGTTLAYPELPQYIEIFGSKGTIAFTAESLLRWDLINPTFAETELREKLLRYQREAEKVCKKGRVLPGTAVPSVDSGHAPIIADFVDAIKNDRPPFINGESARKSVELITAIYESGKNNSKPVKLADMRNYYK